VADRRLLLACVSSAVAGVLLSAFLHSHWSDPSIYSDIGSFWGRSWLQAGQAPYTSANAFFEYPPIAGLILYFCRIVGGDYTGYYLTFSALSLLAAAAMGWSCWRLATDLNVRTHPLYFLLPSVIVYGVYNFDLFNGLFVVLGLMLFVEKKRDASAVFIGLAIVTKLVGIVLLPLLLLEAKGQRARYLAVCAVVAALPLLPILFANPGFFSQFSSFFQGWGLEDAWYIWIFGNPFSSTAKLFGYVLIGALLLRVYTLKAPLVPRSFLALSAYLLGTYIYAPQFSLVLIPLVAVLALNSPALYFWEIFNALIILTWFTVPTSPTSGPTYPWTVPQAMALIRSASLAVLSINVASLSGHPVIPWIRRRFGSEVTVQTTLPESGTSGR
jgi:hypothetical protein